MNYRIYRAKKLSNNEWVYGYYIRKNSKDLIITNNNTEHLIKLSTLGQYIGINDKDDIKIFTGDIIEGKYVGGIVKYFENYGIFGTIDKRFPESTKPQGRGGSSTRYEPYNLKPFYHNRVKNIGNIYDNPNLIGK